MRRKSGTGRRAKVFRYVDDGERFRNLMARLEGSPELVRLALVVRDERGNVVEPERATRPAKSWRSNRRWRRVLDNLTSPDTSCVKGLKPPPFN